MIDHPGSFCRTGGGIFVKYFYGQDLRPDGKVRIFNAFQQRSDTLAGHIDLFRINAGQRQQVRISADQVVKTDN